MASLYKIFSKDGSLVRATKDFGKNKNILENAFRGKNLYTYFKYCKHREKIHSNAGGIEGAERHVQ